MAQQQGQNVMRRYVRLCLDKSAPVMEWFTQHSEHEGKRRNILKWHESHWRMKALHLLLWKFEQFSMELSHASSNPPAQCILK